MRQVGVQLREDAYIMLGRTTHRQVEELRALTETIEKRKRHRFRRVFNGFTRHKLARKISALDQTQSAVPERARTMANGFA